MSHPEYTIVIPARYASSRFPGKPLHLINDRPMILHTADRARESGASALVIATDDDRIRHVCERDGLDVQMTDPGHPSGTDRIAEVADKRKWSDETLIVGLQGDEPATASSHLDLLAHNLSDNAEADMATLCMPISVHEDYINPNRVKLVRDCRDMALYFSRSPIPARRQTPTNGKVPVSDSSDEQYQSLSAIPESFLHIGLYAYRRLYLKEYQRLPQCAIEQEEQLEQLRVLFYGGKIHVGTVSQSPVRGVDHPDDIQILETILRRSH